MSINQNSSIENQKQKMKMSGASLQTKVIQTIPTEIRESFNYSKNQSRQKNKEILEKQQQMHIEQSRTSRNSTKGLFADVTNYYLNRKFPNNTKTLSQEAIMAFQKKLNNTQIFDKQKRPGTSQKFSSRSSQENRKNNFNSQKKYPSKNLSSTMTIQERLRGSNSVKRKQIRRSLFDSEYQKKANLQIIDQLEIRKKEVKKREIKSKSIVDFKKKQNLFDKENKRSLYLKKADQKDDLQNQMGKSSVQTNFEDKKKGKTARQIQNKEGVPKSEDSSHTFRNFKNSTDQESLEQMPNEILSDEGEAKIDDRSRKIVVNTMISRVSLFKEKMSEMASASQKRSCYLSSEADSRGNQRIRLDSDQTIKGQCRVINQKQDDDESDQVCDERTSDRHQSKLEKAISRSSSIRMPHSSQISFQGMPQNFRALTSLYQNPFIKESNPFAFQTSRNNTSQLFNISNIPRTAQASMTKKSEFQKNQMLNYQEYHSLGFKKIGRVSLDAGRGCFVDGLNSKRRINSIYSFDMPVSEKFQLLKSQAHPKSKVIDINSSFDRIHYNDQISQKLYLKNPNSLHSPSQKETVSQVIKSPKERLQTITLSQDLRQQQEEDKKVTRHAISPPYRLQSIYQSKNGTFAPNHYRYHSVNNISKVLNQSKSNTRKSDSSLPLSYGSQGQKQVHEGSLKLFNRRQKKLSENRGCFDGLSSRSSVVPLSSLGKTSRQSKNYLEHNTGVFGQTPASPGDQQPVLDSPFKEQKDFKFIIKINQETLNKQLIQIYPNSNFQNNNTDQNEEEPPEWFKARQVLQQKIRTRCGKVKGILKRVVGTQPNSRSPSNAISDHSSNSVVAYEGGPSKPESHFPKNNSQYQSDQTIRQSSWSESNGIRGLKVNFESSHQMQKKEVDKKLIEKASIFMEPPQSLLSKGVKKLDQNKLDKLLPHDMTFCKKISSCSSYSLKNSKPEFARFEKKSILQIDTSLNSLTNSLKVRETPPSSQMRLARKNDQMVWYAAYDYDLNILEFQTKLADIRKNKIPIEWKTIQQQIPVKIQFDTALADLPFMKEDLEPQFKVILRLYKVTFSELLEIFKRKALGGQFIEDQFSLKQEWKGSQGLFLLQELDQQNAVSEVENCFERYQKSQRILEGISFDSESSSGQKSQLKKDQKINKKPFKNQAEMEYAINEVLKKYFFYLHVNCLKRLPQLKEQLLNTNGLFIEGAPVYYMTLDQSQTSVFIPPNISQRPGNCIEEAVQIMTRFQLFTRIRDRAGTPQSLQYTEVNNTHSKILNSMFQGLIQLGYGSSDSRDYLNLIQGTKIQLMSFPIIKENQNKQEGKFFFQSNISGEVADSQISSELEQNKKKAINQLISNYQVHQQKIKEILSLEDLNQKQNINSPLDKQSINENKSSNYKYVKSCNSLKQISKIDQGQVNIQQINLFSDKVENSEVKQENQTIKILLDVCKAKSIREQTISSKKKVQNSSENKEKQKQSMNKLKNEQACILAIQSIKQIKQSIDSEGQEETRDDGQTDFMPPNVQNQMQPTETILTTEQNEHSLQDLSKSLMNNHMLQKNQLNYNLLPQSAQNYSASGSGSVIESNFINKFQQKQNQDQLVIIREYDDQFLAREGSLLNGSIFSKDSNKEKSTQNLKNQLQKQETNTREEIDQMQPLFSTVQNSNDNQFKDNFKQSKKGSPTVLFQVEKLQKEQIPKENQPLPEITFMKKYHSRSTIDPTSNVGSASKQEEIICSPTSNQEQNHSKQVKEKKKQLKEQLADLLQQWTLEKEKVSKEENAQQIRDLKLLSQLSASAIEKKDEIYSNPQKNMNSQSISDGLETLRQQLESIFEFNKSLIKPLDENDLNNSEIQLRIAKQSSKEEEIESETCAQQVSDHIKKEYESAPKSQTKRVTIVINDNSYKKNVNLNDEFQKSHSYKQKLNSVNKKSALLIDSNNLISKRKIFFGSVGPTSAPSSAGASPICKTLGTFQTKIDEKILNKEGSLEISSMKSILKKKKINSSSSQKSGKSTSEEKKKYEHLFNGLEMLLRQLRQNYNQKFNPNPHKKVAKQISENSSKIGEYVDGLSEFTISSPVANLTIPNELLSDNGQKLDDFYSNPIVATLLSGWDETAQRDRRDNQLIRTSMLQSVNVIDITQSLSPGLNRGKPSTIVEQTFMQNKLTQK